MSVPKSLVPCGDNSSANSVLPSSSDNSKTSGDSVGQLAAFEQEEEVTFASGEFLIHKSTFSGDFDNYDIWCVLDDGYLQKYEPVLLACGERCHQSADVVSIK